MFAKLLKSTLTLILTTLATWTAAIALWRTIGHRPSTVELALGLIGLPIALTAVVSRWRRAGDGKTESSADHPPPVAPPLDSRRWTILATDVMTPLGYTPADVIQALREQQRPELDPTLRDAEGLPIFAARVADMELATLRASLSPDFAMAHTCAEDCLRAVSLLREVCRNLAFTAADGLRADAPIRPVLCLHALLPERWTTERRDAILDLMRATVAAHWQADIEAFGHAIGDDDARSPMERIDLPALGDEAAQPRLAMLAGCDSYICMDAVASLEQREQLLTSRNAQGKIPGEAAVGILIAAPMHASYFAQGPGVVMTAAIEPETAISPDVAITAATHGNPEPAADAPRAAPEPLLPILVDRLLSNMGLNSQTIRTIVSDGHHRGQRQLEVLTFATQRLPHLDPTQDCLSAASGCGYVGAAALPLALALGVQACADSGAEVLYVSTQMAKARMALAIQPGSRAETAPQADLMSATPATGVA